MKWPASVGEDSIRCEWKTICTSREVRVKTRTQLISRARSYLRGCRATRLRATPDSLPAKVPTRLLEDVEGVTNGKSIWTSIDVVSSAAMPIAQVAGMVIEAEAPARWSVGRLKRRAGSSQRTDDDRARQSAVDAPGIR
jgi:hypothetical protein